MNAPSASSRERVSARLMVAGLLALCAPVASQAQLLFHEGFDYVHPAGTMPLAGLGNWTGGQFVIQPKSLEHPKISFSGGAASIMEGSASLQRDTGIATPESGVLWVSFLMQYPKGVVDWQEARLVLGDTHKNQMISIGTHNVSPNAFVVGAGGSYGYFNGAKPQRFETDVKDASVQLIVLRYDFDAVSISFYVNPDLTSGEASMQPVGVITAADGLAPIHMALGRILLRGGNVTSGEVLFDEIRIGKTLTDVLSGKIEE